MIPPFDQNGNLPPGVYFATLAEIKSKYTYTSARQALFRGLKLLATNLKTANCQILYLNGSFITNQPSPGDYDACWEPTGVNNLIDPCET